MDMGAGMIGLVPAAAGLNRDSLPKDLEGACKALEKEFSRMVFEKMRTAMVPAADSKGISSGFALEATQSMLDSQWAELASQGEGLGLWRAMYRQLSGEEVKSGPRGADEKTRSKVVRRDAGLGVQGGAKNTGLPLGSKNHGRLHAPPTAKAIVRREPSAEDREGK